MNLKQLKYVIALADAGSFSKAATILNISQPSLSQYIKKIEEQTGAEFFERSNGSVRITDAGRVYIDIGRKILDLEHQMQNSFIDISEHKSGSVIIGTSPFRSASFMPEIVCEFRKKYPGICPVVTEMETHDLLEAAQKGEFDICITNLPVDERVFDYVRVAEEELLVAVRENNSLDKKLSEVCFKNEKSSLPVIDINHLNGENFVMLTENQVMQRILDDMCYDSGVKLSPVVVVKSIEAQIEMVRMDIGAALVPEGIKKIGNKDIRYYRVSYNLPKRQLAAVYPKNKQLSGVVNDFIQTAKLIKW